jgi:HTH-type transcriptional regulator/antitoxin HipB
VDLTPALESLATIWKHRSIENSSLIRILSPSGYMNNQGGRHLATNTMRIREATDMGHVVRARRRVLGWSQDRLAKTAGVGRQWVLELERGKSGAPLDLLIKLLAVLGFALDVFDDAPARLLASPERGSGRSVGPLANQGERPTGRRPPPPVTLNSIPRQFTSEPSRNGREDTGDKGREYQPTDLAAAGNNCRSSPPL